LILGTPEQPRPTLAHRSAAPKAETVSSRC